MLRVPVGRVLSFVLIALIFAGALRVYLKKQQTWPPPTPKAQLSFTSPERPAATFISANPPQSTSSLLISPPTDLSPFLSVVLSSWEDKRLDSRVTETKLLATRELDFEADGQTELVFISVTSEEGRQGTMHLWDIYNARVGIIALNAATQAWELAFHTDIEDVAGAGLESLDLFEIADLNHDERDEVVFSIRQSGSGVFRSWGVIVDINKRIRLVDRDLGSFDYGSSGFSGHNSIAISEEFVKEEFPVYREGDSNCCPSGGNLTLYFKFKGSSLVLEKFEAKPE